MTFCLKFERFPIWLLGLDAVMIDRVAIMGSSSCADFKRRLSHLGRADMADVILDHISRSRIDYISDGTPPKGSILLVSGSLAFTKSWSLQVPNPVLALCDEHVRSRRIVFSGDLRWSQLRHQTFGGETHFHTMLGTNIPDFEPTRTSL